MDTDRLRDLAGDNRHAMVDELTAVLSGRSLRVPSQLLVRRGLRLRDEAAGRRAIEIIVDDVMLGVVGRLDEQPGMDGLLYSYLEARPDEWDEPDPYLEIYQDDVRQLIAAADDELLRRANARCLLLLPEARRAAPERQAAIELLEQGGGTRSRRRALSRALERAQRPELDAPDEASMRVRDVSEAFIQAMSDDPAHALTFSAFGLIASAEVDDQVIETTLRTALRERWASSTPGSESAP